MKVLVWQWGRRGAGPRFATELADAVRALPGHEAVLSLSSRAELMRGAVPPLCELPFDTYSGLGGLLARLPALAFELAPLVRRIRAFAPDVAICAMPAALDLVMAAALGRLGVPFLVVVHDAEAHPGEGVPLQFPLQRRLVARAGGVIVLSAHIAARVRAQGLAGNPGLAENKPLLVSRHPPFAFGPPPPPPRSHGGPWRLLSFGRLLPYKGLDLLAETLQRLGPRPDMLVRVVGNGPDCPALAALAALPGVSVERRWVPEAEVGALLAWADALVLSHTQASQSGVAAVALAARRWVVATRVGGIAEQLAGEPLARLTEPRAESLADAIRALVEDAADLPPAPPRDAAARAWRDMAGTLLGQIGEALGIGEALEPGEPLRTREALETGERLRTREALGIGD